MKDAMKGFFYSLVGVFLLSTNFITAKFGLSGFNPDSFSLIWTGAATIYSLFISLLFRESRAQLYRPVYIKALLLLGMFTAVTILLGWSGLSMLDPVFASLLWRFFPVMAIIAGVVFLKERLKKEELMAMIIMLFGSVYSVDGRWSIVGKGVIFTLLAGCTGAAQLLIAKAYAKRIHPNVMVTYRVGIAAIFLGIWACLSGRLALKADLKYWLITLLGAFLGPCASFLFTFRSYYYWELSKASMLLTLQPFLVLPMAYIFLGTLPNPKELMGGLIILAGALWLAFIQVKK